jgi:hypothetical protein
MSASGLMPDVLHRRRVPKTWVIVVGIGVIVVIVLSAVGSASHGSSSHSSTNPNLESDGRTFSWNLGYADGVSLSQNAPVNWPTPINMYGDDNQQVAAAVSTECDDDYFSSGANKQSNGVSFNETQFDSGCHAGITASGVFASANG